MVKKFADETDVMVCSSLGQIVGSFSWPTSCLALLKLCNSSKRGFYFKWENIDALAVQDITDVPMFKDMDSELKAKLADLLWKDGRAY